MNRKKNNPVVALVTLAVWIGAFVWAGVPGLVCAVVSGFVMSIGTLVNAGAFHREPDVAWALRRYGEALRPHG